MVDLQSVVSQVSDSIKGTSNVPKASKKHMTIKAPDNISGDSEGKKVVGAIALVSIISAVLFVGLYIAGNVFVASSLLPSNPDFKASDVHIATLADNTEVEVDTDPKPSTSSTATKKSTAAYQDLTDDQVKKLKDRGIAIGKELNLKYLGIELVNNLCSSADSDSKCESSMTSYSDKILDKALNTSSSTRRSGPDGLIITMDIQSSPPFTWIQSHGSTADSFFTSSVKNKVFADAKNAVRDSKSDANFVYNRYNAIFDSLEYHLRGFGTFSPLIFGGIFVISIVIIVVFFVTLRRRYSMSKVKVFTVDLSKITTDLTAVNGELIGSHTTEVYNPPRDTSSGGSGGGGGGGGGGSSGGGGRG